MVKRGSPQLDRVFHALANATRRRILSQVARSDCTVAELSRPFILSPAAISKHLSYLNYARQTPFDTEVVGISVFYKDPGGTVFHFIDLTPKGRDEAEQKPHSQAWVRRHDEYENS
jgi:DNA-binding transcriptional ArsR family regulator